MGDCCVWSTNWLLCAQQRARDRLPPALLCLGRCAVRNLCLLENQRQYGRMACHFQHDVLGSLLGDDALLPGGACQATRCSWLHLHPMFGMMFLAAFSATKHYSLAVCVT